MTLPIRAILVSVDYSDILRITLPYNRRHFDEVWIVTSPADAPNVIPIATANDAEVVVTDLFYEDGADFNKFRALEHALDVVGRRGWICQLDADVLWPKDASDRIMEAVGTLKPGNLYGCIRRMWDNWPSYPFPRDRNTVETLTKEGYIVLAESEWGRLPIHRNIGEWAGFTQLYHANDPVLGSPPWHDVKWAHAGGADSFFQQKWHSSKKVRLPFEVLHLGPAGENWFGRATTLADGSVPRPDAEELRQKTRDLWMERRKTGFTKEKLP